MPHHDVLHRNHLILGLALWNHLNMSKKISNPKKGFFWLWFSALNFPSTAAPGEAELAILQEHLDPQPTRGVWNPDAGIRDDQPLEDTGLQN